MAQDLLAPPKLTVRRFTLIVGVLSAVAAFVATMVFLTGRISGRELLVRVSLVGVVFALSRWAFVWLKGRAERTKPERMPYVHAAVGALTMGACLVIVTIAFRSSIFGASFAQWWILVPSAGMTLAMGGWARRVGESKHCPKCEYEFTFAESDAPVRCPECGTPWLGMLKLGRRVKSPRMVALGIAVAFFGMVVMQPIFYLGPLAKHMPTSVLYFILYCDSSSVFTAWDELAKRPLTPYWTRVMGERVIAVRHRQQWQTAAAGWFDAAKTTGTMPRELVDRAYRESFEAKLTAPSVVTRGSPFPVRLTPTRAVEVGKSTVAIFFAGFSSEGNAGGVGRLNESVWAYRLRPQVFSTSGEAISGQLSEDKTGMIKVTATLWVVHLPSFNETLQWQADGTPVRPATALWFERRDYETTVEVR